MTFIPGTALRDNSDDFGEKIQMLLKSQSYSKLFSKGGADAGQFVAMEQKTGHDSERLFIHDASATNRRFLLKMKDGMDERAIKLMKQVMATMDGSVNHSIAQVYKGLVVSFPDGKLPLSLLKSIEAIEWIEQDNKVKAFERQEMAPWGLARISHPTDPYPSIYDFDTTGKGVTAYLIDSGVLVEHPDLAGRAKIGFSVIKSGEDCAGHGTEVASALAGTNCGVAKECNIVVAQVLDCDGSGDNTDLVAALDWIVENHQKPAIINMSVGGPKSRSIDLAVQRAISKGIPVIVAAGNSSSDACGLSPSGAQNVICVGASTEDNARATFSNFGNCVTLFAPGTNIPIATTPADQVMNGFGFVSGTSIATPIVAGIVALLLEKNPSFSPQEIRDRLLSLAVMGQLNPIDLMGSPNLLAQAPRMSTKRTGVQLLAPGSVPSFADPSSLGMGSVEVATMIGCVVLFGIFIGIILIRFIRSKIRERTPSSNSSSTVEVRADPSKNTII